MILRRKRKKKEAEKEEQSPPTPRLRRVKKDYEGSRWAALILLIVLLLISLAFYLKGRLGLEGRERPVKGEENAGVGKGDGDGWFNSTYVIE